MPAEHDPLTELEIALSGLAPAPPRLDRDGLLYAAGRSAGARRWKQSACGLAVASLALATFIGVRPVREREHVVIVQAGPSAEWKPAPSPPEASRTSEAVTHAVEIERKSSSQLEMRWRMLRWGPDSVPISIGGPEMPARSLEQDLDLPPGSLKGADGRLNGVSSPW